MKFIEIASSAIPRKLILHIQKRRYLWWVIVTSLYFASITFLRATPQYVPVVEFSFEMSLLWALIPLLIGFIIATPTSITIGFLLTCLGPFHKTSIIFAFLTGLIMFSVTLRKYRTNLIQFLRNAVLNRGGKYILILLVYQLFIWLIRLGDSTDTWSILALSASLFTVPFAVYSLAYLPWTHSDIIYAIKMVAATLGGCGVTVLLTPFLIQSYDQYPHAIFVISKALRTIHLNLFTIDYLNPDYNTGSLRSAHFMSAIELALFFGVALYGLLKRDWKAFLLSVPIMLVFLMGENTHIFAGLILGTIVVLCLFPEKFQLSSKKFSIILLGVIAITDIGLILWFYGSDGEYSKSPKGKTYSLSEQYTQTNMGRMIFGEGPAAYSSLASRKRLDPRLTDENPFPIIPQFTSPSYGDVMEHAHVPNTPSTVNRALSGILGIVMEWGLSGTILLLFVAYRMVIHVHCLLRSKDVFLQIVAATTLSFFCAITTAIVFRPYFEYPDVMAVMYILFLLTLVGNVYPKLEQHFLMR